MTTTHDIDINGEPIILDINYQYFKEDGEVIIVIDSINSDNVDATDMLTPAQHQDIVDMCQMHYENHMFKEIEKIFNRIHYGIEDNLDEEV